MQTGKYCEGLKMRLHEFAIYVYDDDEPIETCKPARVMINLDRIESAYADEDIDDVTVVKMFSGDEYSVMLPFDEVVNVWHNENEKIKQ